MAVEGSQSFAKIIEEHLELKRRNASLDGTMPLERYRIEDPFENHPLFKSEEQARLEETLTGTEPLASEDLVLHWQLDEVPAAAATAEEDPEDTLWGRPRDFNWGD